MQLRAIASIVFGGILVAAVAGPRWLTGEDGESGVDLLETEGTAGAHSPSSFDHSLPLDERMRALEQAVSDERYARQLLQDELFVLTAEIEALTGRSRAADIAEDQSAAFESLDAATSGPRRRGRDERRAAQLIEAGFAPDQAEWILQRESQLHMEALQARYEAERTGEVVNYFQNRSAVTDALRNELGDAEYERYLAGSGRPTRVSVSSVLDSSPAQRAGLRPGDEIVSYDGKRIFSMTDLSRQTMEGQVGEQVVVDVLRDGISMQVVVPRGPIGIAGGNRLAR